MEDEIPTDNTYFINTQNDFDKWSNTSFPVGSKVLFAAGKTFQGRFILRGSGTADTPNLAAAYNNETGEVLTEWTDDKPIINGLGKVPSSIFLKNGSYWEINNLEVTNTDGTKGQQGDIFGIHAVAEDVTLSKNITIKNCYVHDVNGNVGGKDTGGIIVVWQKITTANKYKTLKINLL